MGPVRVMVAWYVGLMKGWWYYRFEVFPLCSYRLCVYVTNCEFTIGGPRPFIIEFYVIFPKQKENKEKKSEKSCWKKDKCTKKGKQWICDWRWACI